MEVVRTALPEVLLLEPKVFADERGHFMETYNRRVLAEAAGIEAEFVQDNQSLSRRGVVRGLHYQIRQAQGKLVRVGSGAVWDVAVDIRRGSPRFGQWTGFELSADNRRMAWIPAGFAHGFIALTERAELLYKVTDYRYAEHERTILWNDPKLGIAWPDAGPAIVSPKDAAGLPLEAAETYP